MTWNYRKRVRIAPGVQMNISKGGISTTVGPQGAKLTFGKDGTYLHTGIPGTGLYSRRKISGKGSRQSPNSPIKPNSRSDINMTCLFFILFIVFCVVGCGYLLFSYFEKAFHGNRALALGIVAAIFVIIILIFIVKVNKDIRNTRTNIRKANIKRAKKDKNVVEGEKQGNDLNEEIKITTALADSNSIQLDEEGKLSRYDFFLEKYNKEERSVIEKADIEIKKVQLQIEATSDPIKKRFLQSYIEHYKVDYLSRLMNYSKYSEKDMDDSLDPLFVQAAEKIVAAQQYTFLKLTEWFDYKLAVDRMMHIENQLYECGILDRNFEENNYRVCVDSQSRLNKIIRKAKGKSLVSKEDKVKINEYLEQRKQELIGENTLTAELSDNVSQSYLSVLKAYEALSSCNSKWEIVSSVANSESKSYVDTFIDKESVYGICSKSFNFLNPSKDVKAPFFEFKKAGISFYIYPEFVIAARSETNFDVIKITDLNISFKKQNFVETNKYLIPEDAKFVRYTYKYVNKNGDRDFRYSNNPQYPVYEYGNITFQPYQLTMQFSNSEYAENFYKKILMIKNGGKEIEDSNFGITETYYNKVEDIATSLCNFYERLLQNRMLMLTIDEAITDKIGDAKAKLSYLFLADLIKCYNHLGHTASNLFAKEGLPMFLVENHIISDFKITYDFILSNGKCKELIEKLSDYNKVIMNEFLKNKSEDFFYLNEVFKECNSEDLRIQYFSLLYRFFSIIAKADDQITPEEGKWLEMLMSYSTTSKDYGLEVFEKKASVDEKHTKEKQVTPNAKNDDETNPLEELQTLIGLSEVKEEVSALANFVKIQQEREKKGMKAVGLSYHCVFTGNPGTGKTTVARILAAIYRDLGILKKGHLVETDRSGLVAEYVGQTAVKTNKIIDSALDGVLFIDEAYSLVQSGGNDYGQEAISTLLKRMEDDRNRLIVVLAGYSEEMKRFIDSNPGLQSRFNRYIHFSDYSSDELKQIFMLNVEKNQYLLEPEGEKLLTDILNFAIEHKDKNFGNGRYVRNLFEKTIQNQAIRLSCQPKITAEELSKLKAEDLPTNK